MAEGTAVKVKPLVNTLSPHCAPAHLSERKMAEPHELSPSANLWPVYAASAASHLETSDASAESTLYRKSLPLSIHLTAASMPTAGTGSCVFVAGGEG